MNRSVDRALQVLELLAGSNDALALRDIAAKLDLPKSSVLMLLRALKLRNFVEVDENARYSIGLRSFEIGSAYMRGMSPSRAAVPQLQALTSRLNVTSHFAVLDGQDVLYLAKEEPHDLVVRLASFVGARLPGASTAVGKAQLAYMESATGVPSLGATERRKIRKQGFAVDDGAILDGVRCLAAPVFQGNNVCGAIGVSFLTGSWLDITDVAPLVIQAAQKTTVNLGGNAPYPGAVGAA